MKYSLDRYPKKQDRCTIAPHNLHKQAALFFDKLYIGTSNEEREYFDTPINLTFGISDVDQQSLVSIQQNNIDFSQLINRPNILASAFFKILAYIYENAGHNVVPSYFNYTTFDAEFSSGNKLGFEAVLLNIPIIEQDMTEWSQIIQFREDTEAKRKLRNLRLWLSQGLKAKNIAEATEVIEKKLDDYKWALKKHGLKTITGIITYVFNYKQAAISTAAATAGTVLVGPIGGALASGIVLAGQATVFLAEKYIDREDIKRGAESEVAFIYDARNKFMK
jgi:hypothetical protein